MVWIPSFTLLHPINGTKTKSNRNRELTYKANSVTGATNPPICTLGLDLKFPRIKSKEKKT